MIDVWVFTATNARLVKVDSEEEIDAERLKSFVVSPDLSSVSGIPPHYWRLADGKVIPMNIEQAAQRDQDIAEKGIDNDVYKAPQASTPTPLPKANPMLAMWDYLPWVGIPASILLLDYILRHLSWNW